MEFLRDSEVITPALYNQLAEKLPRTFTPGAPKIDAFSVNGADTRNHSIDEKSAIVPANAGTPSGPPPSTGSSGEMAEAMYHFQPSGPTDLQLFPGQRIQIVEKLNQDWWRGKDIQSNQEGIFPSNYVRIISGPGSGQMAVAPPSYNANSYQQPPQQQYGAPVPQQQQAFPPPSVSYYPQQQPQQQQIQPQPQQQQVAAQPEQAQHHNAFSDGAKKFGSKLGNAAIFGAGATVGSNIVNSIF